MKREEKEMKIFYLLIAVLLSLSTTLSCAATKPQVLVVYNQPQGIRPGDRVLWENQVIGSVGDFDLNPNPKGKTTLPLLIKRDFASKVTEKSRFLIEADPYNPGGQAVRMVQVGPGGSVLPAETVVEGSPPSSLALEKGSSGVQGLNSILQDMANRIEKELRNLPVEEWRRQLERRLDELTRRLQQSSEEVRRRFQKEVLPQIEKSVEELLRILKRLGKTDEEKSVEEKLKELERTVSQ